MAASPGTPKPTNVDEYLDAAPAPARPILEQLRAILIAAAPDAVESLKWRQPAYTRQRIVYCFAGYQDHANFMPTPGTLDAFRDEIEAAGCTATRGVLQIPYAVPLPTDLIRRMAEHRAAAEAGGAKYAV
ncbi:MAG TPA: DUF1801 domain-containing protein [Microbacteriaceae bacterium]|nr:DUF1801 domain-containing protein [Microbacteriaceae bacterium]